MDRIGETTGGNSYRFDPREHGHYGITGRSGTGKTVTKRVLLENCISFGYRVISISPNDRQVLRSAYSKEGGETLPGNYWTGDQLSSPDDLTELVEQNSFISLSGLSTEKKEDWITEFFQYLNTVSAEEPVFVFLDQAHNFSSGSPADVISLIGGKEDDPGIHTVLVMQNPVDFQYDHRDVRENIDIWFFHQGEYTAAANEFMEDGERIRDLNRGECIVVGRGEDVVVSVRMPESELGIVSGEMLEDLD